MTAGLLLYGCNACFGALPVGCHWREDVDCEQCQFLGVCCLQELCYGVWMQLLALVVRLLDRRHFSAESAAMALSATVDRGHSERNLRKR